MHTRPELQWAPTGAVPSADALFVARVRLTRAPDQEQVDSFFLTRAAARAWSSLQSSLISSEVRWITGPAGAGKTHFLNYLIALEGGAGARAGASGRRLTLVINPDEAAAGLLRACATQLAAQLAISDRHKALWSKAADGDGLRAALDQAKRQGFPSIAVILDLGDAEQTAIAQVSQTISSMLAVGCGPVLLIIAAARSAPVDYVQAHFAIAAEPDEEIEIAVRRAHYALCTRAPRRKRRHITYASNPANPFAQSAAIMRAITPAENRIPALAQIAYEALLARDENSIQGVTPVELAELPSIGALCAARLGEAGVRALAELAAAGAALPSEHRDWARRIVAVLKLDRLAGPQRWVALADCAAAATLDRVSHESLRMIVAALARGADGIIELAPEGSSVRLNLELVSTPALAAFNRALNQLRAFVPRLGPVANQVELSAAHQSLRVAMTDALEQASRTGETLARLARRAGVASPPAQTATLTAYGALAARGPAALIEECATDQRPAQIIAEYRHLAALAAAAPQLEAMREYLLGIGLEGIHDDPTRDPAIVRLEAECKLLLVDVQGAVHARSSGVLDALESRFERFKWTYAPFYNKAHDQWREELQELTPIVAQGVRDLAAWRRLAPLRGLDGSFDQALADDFSSLMQQVTNCAISAGFAPELTPRCPGCAFIIGTPSPRRNLLEISGRIRYQVEAILLRLSQLVIARLLREHRDDDRLSAFFKIVQAAQADTLLEVLDEELTAYLGALLEESCSSETAPLRQTGPTKAQLNRPRRRPSASRHA